MHPGALSPARLNGSLGHAGVLLRRHPPRRVSETITVLLKTREAERQGPLSARSELSRVVDRGSQVQQIAVAFDDFRIVDKQVVREQGHPSGLLLVDLAVKIVLNDMDGFMPQSGQCQSRVCRPVQVDGTFVVRSHADDTFGCAHRR